MKHNSPDCFIQIFGKWCNENIGAQNINGLIHGVSLIKIAGVAVLFIPLTKWYPTEFSWQNLYETTFS